MAGSKKAAGVQKLFKPSVPVFRRRQILRNTPPLDLGAPPVARVLLAVGVVLPDFGRLDVSRLVDVERAPYPSAASRLSAANSNTRVPPFIRPYPPRHLKFLKIQAPPPVMGRYHSSIWY
jgi:hypothetical protein